MTTVFMHAFSEQMVKPLIKKIWKGNERNSNSLFEPQRIVLNLKESSTPDRHLHRHLYLHRPGSDTKPVHVTGDMEKYLQRWSYWREHLKYVWNVYCDVTNYRRDHHTTETTGNERFPICHGTNYFHFVLTFSLFTSKQLLFLPICLQYLL